MISLISCPRKLHIGAIRTQPRLPDRGIQNTHCRWKIIFFTGFLNGIYSTTRKTKIGIKHAFTPVIAGIDSIDFDLEIQLRTSEQVPPAFGQTDSQTRLKTLHSRNLGKNPCRTPLIISLLIT